MKTSAIEVHEMLSVLSVDEVEKRIGDVPGVESVTVNYAAGNATVRYDETRLESADIKSAVRQRGFESATPASPSADDAHEGHPASGAPPAATVAAAPSTAPGASAAAPEPMPAAPKPAPDPAGAAPAIPAGDEPKDKTASDKS